jgi:lysophospholipase L1-like esterase
MSKRFSKNMLAMAGACGIAVAVLGADSPVPAFKKGDSVCFIGDSITHGGLYHGSIMLFYATRFPDARFDLHNCGLSGDSAGGALRRFDHDIAGHRPTAATVMLGMNDVNRGAYGKDKTGEEDRKRQQGPLDGYARNMDELAKRLKSLGCRIIFITPSIYDQTGTQAVENLFGVNDALGKCGEIGRDLAVTYQGSVVDFHGPMTRMNAEQQAKDPSYTLVGADRVHPGEAGHLVMAYLFLKAQGMTPCVSTVEIDAAQGKVIDAERCMVSGLKSENGLVSFDCLAQSLPFPVSDGAKPALALVPFVDELNQEMLSVDGLAAGQYEIVIDGQPVQEISAAELKAGVNLATNVRTPQYQQALAVKALNDKRHTLISQRLRTIAAVWHFTLSQVPGLQPDDLAGAEKIMQENLAKAKAANNTYGAWQIETYLQYRPKLAEVEQEVQDATDLMWQACLPRPHRYLIRRKD